MFDLGFGVEPEILVADLGIDDIELFFDSFVVFEEEGAPEEEDSNEEKKEH